MSEDASVRRRDRTRRVPDNNMTRTIVFYSLFCNRGEFQLTSVLDRMRQEDNGMLGCVIHGEALDMGIPGPYVNTMASFSQPHLM